MGTVHVVGGGMAGLAAALRVSGAGRPVVLYEAAQHAGGRCRSFYEASLDCEIDNGNHLLLTGNSAAAAFIRETGADDRFDVPAEPAIPFLDLRTGETWTIRPNSGPIPWWIFCPDRRVPGSRPRDYLAALRLRRASAEDTIEAVLGDQKALYERFWEPIAVAALNTPASMATARLLWPVFAETFGRGGRFARPRFARQGLSHGLVDPAVALLRQRGVSIRFGARLRALHRRDGRIERLEFSSDDVTPGPADSVILAVTAAQAAALIPDIPAPEQFHAIVNVHYRLDDPPPEPSRKPILGLLGGVAEWLFLRGDVASVTVSAADALADEDADSIAARVWTNVAQALELTGGMPRFRVVKERRATFSQTPETEKRRPDTGAYFGNLFLAGDWTNTGLPATIEGAIRSGFRAAELVGSE
jgi:squalene-associated FAD-dependent desaturase